jgi:hypothetical protein
MPRDHETQSTPVLRQAAATKQDLLEEANLDDGLNLSRGNTIVSDAADDRPTGPYHFDLVAARLMFFATVIIC